MDKEKRRFRRYAKDSQITLKRNSSDLRAKLLDYSLDGVGAILPEEPEIQVGDYVSTTISQPDMKVDGKVIWYKKTPEGLRVGIQLVSRITGSLTDFGLADVMLGLQWSGKTGILEVTSGAAVKKVFIKEGGMVFASSNLPEDRLGDLLLSEGKITKEQYDRSSALMKNSGKRHGAALVEIGALKPQDLIWAVMHYVENIILSMFEFEEGGFVFYETQLMTEEVITLKLSAANLIFQGTKRAGEQRHQADYLKDDAVLCFSEDPINLFQDIKLDVLDKKIISLVDGKATLADVLKKSPLKEKETLRTLLALVETRILDVRCEEAPEVEVCAEDIVCEEVQVEEEIQKIDDLFQRHQGLGYYGVLGLKDTATSAEIKKAFYNMAKSFHPDRHFKLPDNMKDKLNTLFSYITTAYTTLSTPDLRREYDRSSASKAKTVSNTDAAREKFLLGKAMFKRENFAVASKYFAEAAYMDSSTGKYSYHYGAALIREGKFREAEKAINRALRDDPFNSDYLAELGHAFLGMNLPLRAKGNFDKALNINPANERAKEGLSKLPEIE